MATLEAIAAAAQRWRLTADDVAAATAAAAAATVPVAAPAAAAATVPAAAIFTAPSVIIKNKYEVLVNGTKYLHKNGALYTLRDRESDPDYVETEEWTFKTWCGPRATHAEDIRAFESVCKPTVRGDCMICMDVFNKSDRKAVCCPYCQTSYCRTCLQTCLLQDTVSQCQEPACRKTWTDEFLAESFTKVFLNTTYRQHREKILLDRERARLPETQEDAARYKAAKALVKDVETHLRALQEEIDAMPETRTYNAHVDRVRQPYKYPEYTDAKTKDAKRAFIKKHSDAMDAIQKNEDYQARVKAVRKKMKPYRSEAYREAQHTVAFMGRLVNRVGEPVAAAAVKKAWTFTMKCPASGCEGFVGLDWVCGLCAASVCKGCQEIHGESTCDPDKVASVKALRKEAKPCPKCAALISKIDGCDQMWCTQCHTAFSWRTGQEETHVHNPHYYQWRRQNGGLAPVPADQQGIQGPVAGCMRPFQVIQQFERIVESNRRLVRHDIGKMPGLLYHYNHVFVLLGTEQTDHAHAESEKHTFRVHRLVGEINDAKWGTELQRLDKRARKDQRLRQLLDMFLNTAADIIRPHLPERELGNVDALFTQLKSLNDYIKQHLVKIRSEFNTTKTLEARLL